MNSPASITVNPPPTPDLAVLGPDSHTAAVPASRAASPLALPTAGSGGQHRASLQGDGLGAEFLSFHCCSLTAVSLGV